MSDAVGAYDRSRVRVAALVTSVDLRAPVPACPAWSVADLLAHLVGIAEDVVAGAVEGMADPDRTAAQVERGRGVGVEVLLARWEAVAPALREAVVDPERNRRSFGPLDLVLLHDLLNHEQDLRTATGCGRVPADDLPLALGIALAPLRRRHRSGDVPPLVLRTTDGGSWRAGEGPAATAVTADPFDLWRSAGGRRTRDEVRGFAWTGDPEPHLACWLPPPFDWPDAPCGP